jgi:hypothetical protein
MASRLREPAQNNRTYLGSATMSPRIDSAKFGSITIDGSGVEHDVLIRLSGEIKKRKKKLSKAVFGTSHIISLEEAEYIFEKGAERLIIGSGHNGNVTLSKEASEYFKKKEVRVDLSTTPDAIHQWNKAKCSTIGLFHVTC